MKIIKEHINEKFKEDTDPVKDMGIGIDQRIYSIDYAWTRNWDNQEFDRKFIGTKAKIKEFIERCEKDRQYRIYDTLETAKLVNKNLHEKFEEDTDPIHDMGIGFYNKHNFKTGQEALDYIWEVFPYLFGGKIPNDIISREDAGFFGKEYARSINDYYHKYLYVHGKNVITDNDPERGMDMWNFNNALHNALIRAGYPLSNEAKEYKRYETNEYLDKPELRIKNKTKEYIK